VKIPLHNLYLLIYKAYYRLLTLIPQTPAKHFQSNNRTTGAIAGGTGAIGILAKCVLGSEVPSTLFDVPNSTEWGATLSLSVLENKNINH